jgi:hypothetical protein
MAPMVTFLLQQMGVPLIAMIVKEFQTAHNGNWPTPEQVAQDFIDRVKYWTDQGNAWLLANPKV